MSTPGTFNYTLPDGNWNQITAVPTQLRALSFKSRGGLAVQFRFSSTANEAQLNAGQIYNERYDQDTSKSWRNAQLWVKGTTSDVIDGDYLAT